MLVYVLFSVQPSIHVNAWETFYLHFTLYFIIAIRSYTLCYFTVLLCWYERGNLVIDPLPTWRGLRIHLNNDCNLFCLTAQPVFSDSIWTYLEVFELEVLSLFFSVITECTKNCCPPMSSTVYLIVIYRWSITFETCLTDYLHPFTFQKLNYEVSLFCLINPKL